MSNTPDDGPLDENQRVSETASPIARIPTSAALTEMVIFRCFSDGISASSTPQIFDECGNPQDQGDDDEEPD
jgi:hypothetical protein